MRERKAGDGSAAPMLAAMAMLIAASMPTAAGPKDAATAGFAYQPRDGSTVMWGSLGATRNSSNANERIQCSVSRYWGSQTVVSCSVRNAKGASFVCSTTSEPFAEALMALRNDGNIEITVDPEGHCQEIEVAVASDLWRKGA